MSKKEEKTVTLSEDQFNALINKLSILENKVTELSERPQGSSNPPVFYSSGKSPSGTHKSKIERKETVLSSPTLQTAIDYVIKDFKKNPPRGH